MPECDACGEWIQEQDFSYEVDGNTLCSRCHEESESVEAKAEDLPGTDEESAANKKKYQIPLEEMTEVLVTCVFIALVTLFLIFKFVNNTHQPGMATVPNPQYGLATLAVVINGGVTGVYIWWKKIGQHDHA